MPVTATLTRLLCVLGLLIQLAPPAVAAPVLSLCYNKDGSPPWIDSARPGLMARMFSLVATEVGMQARLVGMPWQRCLLAVKAGSMDGALGASFKEERREFGRYPELERGRLDPAKRLFDEQYVLVRPKGSKAAWDGKTVQPRTARIAAMSQVSIVATLRALGLAVDDGTRNSEATLRKVLLGRADAAIMLANGVQFELGHHAELADKLEVSSPPVEVKPYFLMLGYAVDEELARRLWDACEQVRESSEFAAQQKAYFSGQ